MLIDFASHVRDSVLRYGDERSFVFTGDGGVADERLGHAELDRRARRIASWLVEDAEAGRGRPVLLLYSDLRDFLPAFLACLYAGVVAVPAPMPRDRQSRDRVAAIVGDTDTKLALTAARDKAALGLPADVRVEISDDDSRGDETWDGRGATPDSVAFLQYTSGSTGEPKGVVVTHRNLMHNQAAIQRGLGTDDSLVTAGWLPYFHDMGLIGLVLHPLYVGGSLVYLPPSTFLRRPVRWLQAISRFGATFTVAPDFAYDLCARTVTDEQLAGLDLSTLRSALTGAEPVRAATLEKFSRRFETAGFRQGMFVPCYGMAEVTLLATTSSPGVPPTVYAVDSSALERGEIRPGGEGPVTRLVGCGAPEATEVRIVHPDTRSDAAPGQVGEVWLAGESVAAGYAGQPDASAEVFGAHTADGTGPYLRTGDLGTLIAGELFVTGRLKDMLVVNGRNLHNQDVEQVVREAHPSVGTAAVFSVSEGPEHIVVVCEVRRALVGDLGGAEVAGLVKSAVAGAFGVTAPSVVLTLPGAVRRTTSGKVRRAVMRSLFLAGQVAAWHEDLQPVARRLRTSSPANPVPGHSR